MHVVEVSRSHSSCIVCSDLHCGGGAACWQLQVVLEAARAARADCLLILGDLFDKLHRRVKPEELKQHISLLLGDRRLPERVYYVTSLSSHDPILSGPVSFEICSSEVLVVPGILRLSAGGLSICGLHGDAVVRSGVLAHLVNRVASAAGRGLLLEEMAKRKFCSPCDWVLTGHTHVPGVDPARKLGNPGSWKARWRGGIAYWRHPSFTVLEVARGEVRLLRLARRR